MDELLIPKIGYERTARSILGRLVTHRSASLGMNVAQGALQQISVVNTTRKTCYTLRSAIPAPSVTGPAAEACHALAEHQLSLHNYCLAASLAGLALYLYKQAMRPEHTGLEVARMISGFI